MSAQRARVSLEIFHRRIGAGIPLLD